MVALKELKGGLLLEALVKTGSKKNLISFDGETLVIETKEKPEQNRANLSIIKIVSKGFGVPQSSVEIVGGIHSKRKSILVMGADLGALKRLKT